MKRLLQINTLAEAHSLIVMDDVLPSGFAVQLDDEAQPDGFDVGRYRILYEGERVGRIERHFEFLDPYSSNLHLHRMVIDQPDLRGCGFGRACMDETIRRSSLAGIATLTMHAVEDGRWLWRDHGFVAEDLSGGALSAALDQGSRILQLADVQLGDQVRWQSFAHRALGGQEPVTMHDIHDFMVAGQTLAQIAQSKRVQSLVGLYERGDILSWNGILKN